MSGWRWVDPEGRVSRTFLAERDARASAVFAACIARRPGRAIQGAEGRVDVLWPAMARRGWRLEPVEERLP